VSGLLVAVLPVTELNMFLVCRQVVFKNRRREAVNILWSETFFAKLAPGEELPVRCFFLVLAVSSKPCDRFFSSLSSAQLGPQSGGTLHH